MSCILEFKIRDLDLRNNQNQVNISITFLTNVLFKDMHHHITLKVMAYSVLYLIKSLFDIAIFFFNLQLNQPVN